MQTELSKREKERLRDSLLRLFPSYSERVDALSLLIQILDNVELEQAIECEPSMDTTPLSGALSLLGYLDSRKETDRTLLALIPDTIRARPHYAKLKAFLFVSCVGLHDGLSAPSADIPYIPVHRSLFSPSVAHPPAAVRTPVVSAALLSRLFPPDRPATSRRPLVPAAPPPPPAPPVPQDEKKSAVVRKGDKS